MHGGLCTDTSVTKAMQWVMTPHLQVMSQSHMSGRTPLPQLHCSYVYTQAAEGSPQHRLDAQTQDDEKILWNHFILSVLWFHFCRKVTDLNICLMSCSEANRWSFEHRRHETIFINNLAYIAHHKHAYIVSTNREIEREQEEEGREDYKRIHQINFFSQKYHQRTETGTTTDEKEKKILRGRKRLLNTEQRQCKERNIRQLHSSHINRSRIFFSGIFFRQFLNHINGCMSGTNERLPAEHWTGVYWADKYWSRMTWAVCLGSGL